MNLSNYYFHGIPLFTWKKESTEKLWLYRIGYLAEKYFVKIEKKIVLFQSQQVAIISFREKFELFSEN